MLEIPYWIEGEVPAHPIDIRGIAGRVPNGFETGAGCTIAVFWVADLYQQWLQANDEGRRKRIKEDTLE